MIRPLSAFAAVVLCLALQPSRGVSQSIDTARVRATYDSVAAVRAEYERLHGRFVTVNGIRMHFEA